MPIDNYLVKMFDLLNKIRSIIVLNLVIVNLIVYSLQNVYEFIAIF